MKKLLLTVTLSLACVAAFAQGKVNFQNNSLHLIYWDPGLGTAYAGQAYLNTQGPALTIELWGGTSSSSLSLQGTTDFTGQASPGTWASRNLIMASLSGAAGLFFDIEIYDPTAGSYSNAVTSGHIYGTSGVFNASASSGTAYYSLVQHTTPGNSTWADGTYALDSVSPGFRGAIMLTQVPEPTTIALVGLAGSALVIMRRRK